MLEICGRLRPMRFESSSCVMAKSSISCWYAEASSRGFSCARWRFSSSASRSMASSGVSLTIAGMLSSPARWLARQRRSPMMSSNFVPSSPVSAGRTTIGCRTPNSRIECSSSLRSSSSKTVRG